MFNRLAHYVHHLIFSNHFQEFSSLPQHLNSVTAKSHWCMSGFTTLSGRSWLSPLWMGSCLVGRSRPRQLKLTKPTASVQEWLKAKVHSTHTMCINGGWNTLSRSGSYLHMIVFHVSGEFGVLFWCMNQWREYKICLYCIISRYMQFFCLKHGKIYPAISHKIKGQL